MLKFFHWRISKSVCTQAYWCPFSDSKKRTVAKFHKRGKKLANQHGQRYDLPAKSCFTAMSAAPLDLRSTPSSFKECTPTPCFTTGRPCTVKCFQHSAQLWLSKVRRTDLVWQGWKRWRAWSGIRPVPWLMRSRTLGRSSSHRLTQSVAGEKVCSCLIGIEDSTFIDNPKFITWRPLIRDLETYIFIQSDPN